MKLKLIFSCLFLFITFQKGFSQNFLAYNTLLIKADIAVNDSKNDSALYFYQKAFEISTPYYYQYIDAAKIALILKNYITCEKLLRKALFRGANINDLGPKKIPELSTSIFNNLKNNYNQFHAEYLNNIDQDYLREISILHAKDQAIRNKVLFEADSVCFKNNIEQAIAYIDSTNFADLIALSKNKGFPTREKVGDFGFQDAWLLLWHHRNSFPETPQWKEIKPFIDEAISKKTLSPDFYALFIDFKRFSENQPQLYGTMFSQLRFSSKYDQTLIEDPKNLNSRRREIGMPSFEDDIRSMGINLPATYASYISD